MRLVFLKKASICNCKGIIAKIKNYIIERFIHLTKRNINDYEIYEVYDKYDKNYKSLINKLKKNKVTHVVICKKLENELLHLRLYLNNIEIITGRNLLCDLSYSIFIKVSKLKHELPQQQKVHILVHRLNEVNKNNIVKIIKQANIVNIVTDHVYEYNKFANNIEEDLGILISVSNNKTKSLRRSSIIINIDYTEEQVNKFKICNNAILINLKYEVNIKKKAFCGYCINKFEIFEENIIENLENAQINTKDFDSIKLIEAEVLNDKIYEDIKIENLIGNRNTKINSISNNM